MLRTKPASPPEFKAEAVRLVGSSDRSLTRIAKDLRVAGPHACGTGCSTPRSTAACGDVLTPSEREAVRQRQSAVRTRRHERDGIR